MKKRVHAFAVATIAASVLIACGGGGGKEPRPPYLLGNPDLPGSHTTITAAGGGSTGSGSTANVKTPTIQLSVVTDTGAPGNIITGTQASRVKVLVRDESGKPVPGLGIKFDEQALGSGGLLDFVPATATALTDEKGEASVEVVAKNAAANNGSVTGITASIGIGDQKYTTLSANAVPVKIQAGAANPSTGQPIDPHTLVNAINFVEALPSDQSIVIQGTGGLGRTESAQLTFRVVDEKNIPLEGVTVHFALNDSTSGVTLRTSSVTTGSDGKAIATVTSGTKPTSVVLHAYVMKKTSGQPDKRVNSQSSTITVTNSIATQAGFDLSAKRYNLNLGVSGDETPIVVRIRDRFGNAVPEGTPVVFTASHGKVGTAQKGGCNTDAEGKCEVKYTVQNPRPADGEWAVVTASTRLGTGEEISDSLVFSMSDVAKLGLYKDRQKVSLPLAELAAGALPTTLAAACGKNTVLEFAFGTLGGLPAPGKTVIEAKPRHDDVKVDVIGVPTSDGAAGPAAVAFKVDSEKFCEAAGGGEVIVDLTYKSPSEGGFSNGGTQASEVIKLRLQ